MPIETRVFERATDASRAAAERVINQLQRTPTCVIGLATGRTMIPIYAEIARAYGAGTVDFSRVQTINLDEFVGLASTDRCSFRSFMERHLFRHVNIRPEAIHFLNGRASSLDDECDRYERLIESLGGIDLQLLGVGENAHIGFNEPADALWIRSHAVRLTLPTRRASASLFGGDTRLVPREAVSMGIGTILGARSIVLVATGRAKARAAASIASGRVSTRQPASFLQLHSNVEVILDRAAVNG